MNILSINQSDQFGIVAETIWHLNQSLIGQGHQINMFVCDKTTTADNVFTVPRPRWRFYLSHLLGTDINLFQSDSILKTEQFKQADIVHCHNLHGHYFNLQTLAKMAKLKPVIWTLHDMWALTHYCPYSLASVSGHGFYPCSSLSGGSVVKRLNRSWLRQQKTKIYEQLSITITVPSEWMQYKVARSILMDKNLHLIHDGIDVKGRPTVSQKLFWRKKLFLPIDAKLVLLMVDKAGDSAWQGLSYVKQVLSASFNEPKLKFLVIGAKGDWQNNDRVILVDSAPDQSILSQYFAAADIFLTSAVAEGFSTSVLLALAAGLPVVGFAVGINNEVVRHGVNGYIGDNQSSDVLIDGLRFFLDIDQKALNDVGAMSQALIARDFSLELMVQNYQKLYRDILACGQ